MSAPSFLGAPVAASTWKRTAFALVMLPFGVIGFTFVVTGLSVGLGLIITLLGLPIVWFTLAVSRWLGRGQAAWITTMLDMPIEPAGPPVARDPDRWLSRMQAGITDGSAWRAVGYWLLALPLGVLEFTVAVTGWSIALGGVTASAWWWALPDPDFLWEGNRLDQWWEWAGMLGIGVVFVFVTPWLVRWVTSLDGVVARALLSDRGSPN